MKIPRIVGLLCLLLVPAFGSQREGIRGVPPARKLFVDVSEADYVEVIDADKRQVVDKIIVGKHPHGLALGRRVIGGRAYDMLYVTVEETGELVIVDAQNQHVLGRVSVGKEPNQLTLTQDGQFAYVPLRGEAQVAIVELGFEVKTRASAPEGVEIIPHPRVVKRVPIGEWPHNSYTGETSGRIYVTSFQGKKIHVFDPKKNELLFEMKFPGEVRPVALTRDESRAYVALSDFHGFVVADIPQRKVIGRVELPPLPAGTPEPFLKTYVHGLALSPDEHELWVTSCAGAALYVYSLPGLKLQAKVPMGKFPHWFAWQARREHASSGKAGDWVLWVSQTGSDQVSAVDPSTRKVVANIPTGPGPKRIVVSSGLSNE